MYAIPAPQRLLPVRGKAFYREKSSYHALGLPVWYAEVLAGTVLVPAVARV